VAVSGFEDLRCKLPALALHCREWQEAGSGLEDLHWELSALCRELQVAVLGFEDLHWELPALALHCRELRVVV